MAAYAEEILFLTGQKGRENGFALNLARSTEFRWTGRAMKGSCVYIYIYKIQEEILDFRGSGFRGKSTSRKGIVFLCPYPSPSRVIDGYLSAGETLFFAPKNLPPRGWGNICISFLLKISWKFWSFNFFSLINLKGIITNMHDYKNFNDPQF